MSDQLVGLGTVAADHHHACACCTEHRDGPPLSYGAPAPAAWKPRYSRRRDSELTADQCVIKGRHFFVHGLIEIPVRDSGDTFSYPHSTLLLKTHVHTRAVGERPLIEVEPTDRPLAIEQREGITTSRVRDLADLLIRG
ncbi:DUF2199 domain-containing protein [Streptomyces sp. NPDC026092]|uniref:DUF2199 domain-containing protein n=1 Tax=Streptomyces sp. NPDC026092 TaxID=3154797 RepID=UPI0033D04456